MPVPNFQNFFSDGAQVNIQIVPQGQQGNYIKYVNKIRLSRLLAESFHLLFALAVPSCLADATRQALPEVATPASFAASGMYFNKDEVYAYFTGNPLETNVLCAVNAFFYDNSTLKVRRWCKAKEVAGNLVGVWALGPLEDKCRRMRAFCKYIYICMF